MDFVRFDPGDGRARPGFLSPGGVVDLLEAPIPKFDAVVADERPLTLFTRVKEVRTLLSDHEDSKEFVHDLDDVSLERPWSPGKVVCLEGCYEQDLEDDGYDPQLADEDYYQQDWPSVSVAPTSALRGPSESLRIPSYAQDVRPGIELGFVVGEEGRAVDETEAMDLIAGYTPTTNLRIYDGLPNLEGYKTYDHSIAYGPSITPLDGQTLDSLSLTVDVNGTSAADHSTDEWRFSPSEMVAEISRIMTLEPGDLITTGSPTRILDSLEDGDAVTVRVGETHQLTNPIERDETHVE